MADYILHVMAFASDDSPSDADPQAEEFFEAGGDGEACETARELLCARGADPAVMYGDLYVREQRWFRTATEYVTHIEVW